MRYRKVSIPAILLSVIAIALTAAACGANQRDLKGVEGRNPDKVELYINVDQHPNIVRLCIGGVAIATTSRQDDNIIRVPEWDTWCRR